jgi:hypothetical protein
MVGSLSEIPKEALEKEKEEQKKEGGEATFKHKSERKPKAEKEQA